MDKKYLLFNVNIIAAGLIALFVSAKAGIFFDSLFKQHELTSLASTITHFAVYLSLNSIFHYFTNKKRYKSVNKKLFVDLAKIYGTQIPTFAIYYGLFFFIIDILLHNSFSPVFSNITAWFIGTLISRIVHTYLAHKAGVFRE